MMRLVFVISTSLIFCVGCAISTTDLPPTDCLESPIHVRPTATRFATNATSEPKEKHNIYCPPVVATLEPEPTLTPPSSPDEIEWNSGASHNITLSPHDEQLVTATAGNQRTALIWRRDANLHIAQSQSGTTRYIEQIVQNGDDADIAFDGFNNAHLVYVQDGKLLYRYAPDGTQLSAVRDHFLDLGIRPQIKVDRRGQANVLYLKNNAVTEASQLTVGSDLWRIKTGLPNAITIHLAYAGHGENKFFAVLQTTTNEITVLRKFGTTGQWVTTHILEANHTIVSKPHIDIHEEVAAIGWLSQAGERYFVEATVSIDGGNSWKIPRAIAENHDGSRTTGAYTSRVLPIIRASALTFITIYEEGDPPAHNPNMQRLGRPTIINCLSDLSACTDSPGELLVEVAAIRPIITLNGECNADHKFCTLVWSARQSDNISRDIYTTIWTAK